MIQVPFGDNYDQIGKLARVDLDDLSPSGVSMIDLTDVDTDLKGFSGGFTGMTAI